MFAHSIIIRPLQYIAYSDAWQAMREFTDVRASGTPDEVWLIEHPSVYTLGQAGNPEHILNPKNIPIIKTDRGGQVTYHGPGQLVVYPLIDIRRLKISVRDLVCSLEQAVIGLLAEYGLTAIGRRDAPGVYVDGAKICSVGLRIRRGCSYHGLALNIAMDLQPFQNINPCGYANLAITQLSDLGGPDNINAIALNLTKHLVNKLGYTSATFI